MEYAYAGNGSGALGLRVPKYSVLLILLIINNAAGSASNLNSLLEIRPSSDNSRLKTSLIKTNSIAQANSQKLQIALNF